MICSTYRKHLRGGLSQPWYCYVGPRVDPPSLKYVVLLGAQPTHGVLLQLLGKVKLPLSFCIHMHTFAYICMRMHTYAYACICMHTYAYYAYVRIDMHTYAYVCIRMHHACIICVHMCARALMDTQNELVLCTYVYEVEVICTLCVCMERR